MGTETQTPWEEALDLDDSSSASHILPLRPLKRHRILKNPTSSSAVTAKTPSFPSPFLHRCHSLISQSSQTQQTTKPNLNSQLSPPPNPSSPAHPIPGPAGTVQAAILRRKNEINDNLMGFVEEDIVSTQEYIRRAVEDGGTAIDDDFCRNPWLCAVDFVRREGPVVDGDGAIGIPLSAIRAGPVVDKVAQVVAIVKSCTPNGLGGMMVTLKDPTGIIDASIHRTVLTEVEFGKDISVGAVIIVQKVSVFSPSRSRHYLNITKSNVVKVISRDGEASLQQTSTVSPVEHAAREAFEESQMPHKQFSLSQGRTQGIMNSLRQNAIMTAGPHIVEPIGGDMATEGGSQSDRVQRNQNAASREEHFVVLQNLASATKEVTDATGTNNNGNEVLKDEQQNPWNQVAGRNISRENQHCSAAMKSDESKKQENGDNDEVRNRKALTLRASVPQWTDEQLEELFAFD